MLLVTKIFYFEMAHAIHGYAGACKNIHGHSYELEVTVSGCTTKDEYIPAPVYVPDKHTGNLPLCGNTPGLLHL